MRTFYVAQICCYGSLYSIQPQTDHKKPLHFNAIAACIVCVCEMASLTFNNFHRNLHDIILVVTASKRALTHKLLYAKVNIILDIAA